MLTTTILISLMINLTISGTGNESGYLLHNDTMENFGLNMSIIRSETSHIISGIPDAPPALEPRYPMNPPTMQP